MRMQLTHILRKEALLENGSENIEQSRIDLVASTSLLMRVCVHYCLMNSSLRLQEVDGVWCCGRFIVFAFIYSDVVVVVSPISHSPDGFLFSRHLLGWRWRHENNNIFSGNDALLTAYVCRNDDSCGLWDAPNRIERLMPETFGSVSSSKTI